MLLEKVCVPWLFHRGATGEAYGSLFDPKTRAVWTDIRVDFVMPDAPLIMSMVTESGS